MEHLLISACLLGAQCRYDGQSKPVLEMVALSEQFDLVPLCPEQLGGLPTPRTPAERIEDHVMTKDGRVKLHFSGRKPGNKNCCR